MIHDLRRHTSGFTILETIIVLTVTIALLGSTLALFQQRVPRTQFIKAVNELNTQITDVASQVAAGNYPTSNNFSCDVDVNGVPVLYSGTSEQGTNQNCIFIGQAIKFGKTGSASCELSSVECDDIKVFTVFGNRTGDDLVGAKPRISNSYANQSYKNGFGLSVTKIKPNNASLDVYSGVAYTLSFGSGEVAGNRIGPSQVAINPIGGATNLNNSDLVFVDGFNEVPPNPSPIIAAVPQGILVCLKSGTTDQRAVIILGADGNPSSVEMVIVNNTEWGSTYGCL